MNLLSTVAEAAIRYRSSRGGNAAFAVIGGVVVSVLVIMWIVGPKKASKVDPRTGFERQTLPTYEAPTKKYVMWAIAGALAALALFLAGPAFVETKRGYGPPLGGFAGFSAGVAMVVFFLAGGFERLACALGAGFGFLLMLKPAFFGYVYDDSYSGGSHPLSYTASSHMESWVVPGVLVMFFAGLFFIRYLRQR